MGSKHWTKDEDVLLDDLIRCGKDVRLISKRLGRTQRAIYMRVFALGGLKVVRAAPYGEVRSLESVARLFGVRGGTVRWWIRNGWIVAQRNQSRRNVQLRFLLITDEAIQVFIEDRRWWPAWSLHRMTDADWRDYARERRRIANGRWIGLRSVASLLNYAPATMSLWWHAGKFQDYATTRVGRHCYLWSEDVPRLQHECKNATSPKHSHEAPQIVMVKVNPDQDKE